MSRARRRRVAVIGATGFLGQRLGRAWVRGGADVRCMARQPAAVDVPGATAVGMDLDRRGSLVPALREVDVAYYLVHAMSAGSGFADRDRRYAKRFARAAKAAGVGRVIYVGGLFPRDAKLSDHLASRREVGDVLMRGCGALVVRAGMVAGSGSASWIMLRDVARLPAPIIPSWGTTRCQSTGVRDLVTALQAAADLPAGREVDACGPDILTYREMVCQTAAVLGVRRLAPLPAPCPVPTGVVSLALRVLTAVPPALVGALVESLPHEMIGDGIDLYAELGMRPQGFAATVRHAAREDRLLR